MLVKVWNRNSFDHLEKFRNKTISIKAGSYAQMDYHDAIDFLGQFWPPRYNKGGQALPESFKFLEIDVDDRKEFLAEMDGEQKKKADKCFVCGMCNKEFPTKVRLIKHVKANHQNNLADPEGVEDLAEDGE